MNELQEVAPKETQLLDRILGAACNQLDNLATAYGGAIAEAGGHLARAMILAEGIRRLRQALVPEIMSRVMELQGTALGFRTDKDKGQGYSEAVVKECLIEALLRGVHPVGNEFNIIAERCYVTKEGYQRKLKELPGLTDLVLSPGTPVLHNGQMVVRFIANWKYKGIPDELKGPDGKPGRVIAIITHQGTSVDNMVGKATRKALKAIYEQATGTEHSEPDEDEDQPRLPAPPSNGSKTDQLADRLGAAVPPAESRESHQQEEEAPPGGQSEAAAPAGAQLGKEVRDSLVGDSTNHPAPASGVSQAEVEAKIKAAFEAKTVEGMQPGVELIKKHAPEFGEPWRLSWADLYLERKGQLLGKGKAGKK